MKHPFFAPRYWLTALLFFCFPAWLSAAPPYQRMQASTVRVLCITGEGAGAGTGFVIDEGRHVVTNWHVVACTGQGGMVKLLVPPETLVDATVAWTGKEKLDVAILKLSAPLPAPAVRFAGKNTLSSGDQVVVAGFPGAADEVGGESAASHVSVTDGIISRVYQGRPTPNADIITIVQTNAALNPGNSGGPLFNAFGQVIGINSQKSLTGVPALESDGRLGVQRVPLGEGIGWAIGIEEIGPALASLNIPFHPARSKPNVIAQLWYREPVLVLIMALFAMLMLAMLYYVTLTREGKELVQEVVTKSKRFIQTDPVLAERPDASQVDWPILRMVAGPDAGCELELGDMPLVIGRDPRVCQLVLNDQKKTISKRHCIVRYAKEQKHFYVEDCWSTNGVLLENGVKITPGKQHQLRAGEKFSLGSHEYQFMVGNQ